MKESQTLSPPHHAFKRSSVCLLLYMKAPPPCEAVGVLMGKFDATI